jgi:hypothetical protein
MTEADFPDAPAFRHAVEPGEMLNAPDDLDRFEPYLPRDLEEEDAQYLARVVRVGMAVTISSDQVAGPGGMTALKDAIARATRRRVPLVRLTGELPPAPRLDYDSPARDAAKLAALAAARNIGR